MVQARAHVLRREVTGHPVHMESTYPMRMGPLVCGCWAFPMYPHFVPPYLFISWTYMYSPPPPPFRDS